MQALGQSEQTARTPLSAHLQVEREFWEAKPPRNIVQAVAVSYRLCDDLRIEAGRDLERTTRPCRPPLLTRVCKRGGRPPSAFRLLPCGYPPGACSPARCDRGGLPILIVLDQNRWTSTCIADTLLSDDTAAPSGTEHKPFPEREIEQRARPNGQNIRE